MKRKTIAHYEILRRLGAGGSGVVYAANDTLLQRPVVLKMRARMHGSIPWPVSITWMTTPPHGSGPVRIVTWPPARP